MRQPDVRSGKISVEQYDRERLALRAQYGDPRQGSGVKGAADQALARMFVRSGWSTKEIADREGTTPESVMLRTRLHKVMAYCEERGVAPPANLTAIMLRDKYWKGVGRTGPRNHRQQLARVFAMMQSDRDLGWGGGGAVLPALIEPEARLAPAPSSGSTVAAEELLGLPAEDIGRSLPELYEQTKVASAQVTRLEDCKISNDKALALAAYAERARDPELRAHCRRVVAVWTRRAGQLLSEIRPSRGGRPAETREVDLPSFPTRKDAAADAGVSEYQRRIALRLARIPQDAFDRLVERPEPATIDELEAAGRAVRAAELGRHAPAPIIVEAEPAGAAEVGGEDRDISGEPLPPGEAVEVEGRPATEPTPTPLPKFDPGTTSPTDHGSARAFLWAVEQTRPAVRGLESFDLARVARGLTAAQLAAVAGDVARFRAILHKIDEALGLTVDA